MSNVRQRLGKKYCGKDIRYVVAELPMMSLGRMHARIDNGQMNSNNPESLQNANPFAAMPTLSLKRTFYQATAVSLLRRNILAIFIPDRLLLNSPKATSIQGSISVLTVRAILDYAIEISHASFTLSLGALLCGLGM